MIIFGITKLQSHFLSSVEGGKRETISTNNVKTKGKYMLKQIFVSLVGVDQIE